MGRGYPTYYFTQRKSENLKLKTTAQSVDHNVDYEKNHYFLFGNWMFLVCIFVKCLNPFIQRCLAPIGWNGPFVLEKILKFYQCIFAISLLSPLGKGRDPSFEQIWIVNVFSVFLYYPPLKKGHLNKLESLNPRLFCAKFSWNGSGEVEKIMKTWTRDVTIDLGFRLRWARYINSELFWLLSTELVFTLSNIISGIFSPFTRQR